MNSIINDIQQTLQSCDPELLLVEDQEEQDKDVSLDAYQKAIDNAKETELNPAETKTLQDLEVSDLDQEKETTCDVEQVDAQDVELKPDDKVAYVLDNSKKGIVKTVGELVEVLWNDSEDVSVEYPESLIHVDAKASTKQEPAEVTTDDVALPDQDIDAGTTVQDNAKQTIES